MDDVSIIFNALSFHFIAQESPKRKGTEIGWTDSAGEKKPGAGQKGGTRSKGHEAETARGGCQETDSKPGKGNLEFRFGIKTGKETWGVGFVL